MTPDDAAFIGNEEQRAMKGKGPKDLGASCSDK